MAMLNRSNRLRRETIGAVSETNPQNVYLFHRHGLVWSSGGSNLLGIEASINYPGKQPSQDHIDGVEEMHDIGIEMQDRAKRGYVGGKETVKFTQKQTNVVHRVFLSV